MSQQSSHIEIAEEMLDDAQAALTHDFSLRTVEDRAFYAMYHAALEALEHLGEMPKTQSGTIARFGKLLVKERAVLDPEYHRMLSRYQAKRQEADYEKVFLDDEDDARAFVADAEQFVSKIKQILPEL